MTFVGSTGKSSEKKVVDTEPIKKELAEVEAELDSQTWVQGAQAALEQRRAELLQKLASAQLGAHDVFDHSHEAKAVGEASGLALRGAIASVHHPRFLSAFDSAAETLTLLAECSETIARRARPPQNALERIERLGRAAVRSGTIAVVNVLGGAQRAREYTHWVERTHGLLEKAGAALALVAGAAQALTQYDESTATTTAGRVVDGLAEGAITTAVLLHPVTAAILLADSAQALVTHTHLTEPVARHVAGTVHFVVGAAEALITQDTSGIERLNRQASEGKFGPLLKAASESGVPALARGFLGPVRPLFD